MNDIDHSTILHAYPHNRAVVVGDDVVVDHKRPGDVCDRYIGTYGYDNSRDDNVCCSDDDWSLQ